MLFEVRHDVVRLFVVQLVDLFRENAVKLDRVIQDSIVLAYAQVCLEATIQ